MEITADLLKKIKANLTTTVLQPVPASVSFYCDECAGACGFNCGEECLGSCGSTCNITCLCGPKNESEDSGSSGW